MLETILVGILSSVAASCIFLLCLYQLRPSIDFSPCIADQSAAIGVTEYAFKIVNRSKWSAVDLDIEVSLVTPIAIAGGTALKNTPIVLRKNHLFELQGYDKKDKDGRYALRFVTTDDLNNICKTESDYYVASVKARHAFSGFTKVFSQQFIKSNIKKGKHAFGLDVAVL